MDKIRDTIIKMLTIDTLSVYGEILSVVVFEEDNKIPTIGVRIYGDKYQCCYNDSFIKSLSDKELTFILVHVAMHLLLKHLVRSNNKNHFLDNYAQDAVINTIINNTPDIYKYAKICSGAIFIDSEYQGKLYFEEYYLWLIRNKPELMNNDISKQQVGFDVHLEDIATEEEIQIAIDTIITDIKNRGLLPDNIEEILSRKIEKQKDYLKTIKRTLSNTLLHSQRVKTFLRPNRYGIEGLKGYFYNSYEINCILDTSGSMFGDFEKVLSYLQNNKVVVNLIQIDTKIHNVERITKTKCIKDIKIKGGGGTILQPAINKIAKNKQLNRFGTLILTDGWTDHLDLSKLHKNVLIISTNTEVPIKKHRNNITQIVIK